MAFSRGMYGQRGRVTTEYFSVSAIIPEGGSYMWMTDAPTRGIAYSQMQRRFPGCRIELFPMTKEEYEDRGGFEPILPRSESRCEPLLDRG